MKTPASRQPRNRVIAALEGLGGSGTTSEITEALRARPECISAQVSNLERAGLIERDGQKVIRARRWNHGHVPVWATIWRLK